MKKLISGRVGTAAQVRNIVAALGITAALVACAPQPGGPAENTGVQVPKVKLPPVRSAYESLSPRDRARHVIAVQRALENPASGQVENWKGQSSAGTVTVVTSHKMDSGRLCRLLVETIETADGTLGLNDVACWSGQSWTWLRQNTNPQVLAPLATHEVKRKRSFRNLARRLKVRRADLKVLNPLLGDQIEKGAIVFLPRAG